MNKIKCIFLDIDNTLTDSNQNISQQTSDYFSKINKDCLIILVTGRNNIYAIEKSKTANASKIVIADNGAVIYDYGKNQVLYKNIFDKALINLIWDISQAYNIDCVFNSIYKRYRNNKYMNSRFLGQHTIGINNPNEIEDDITQIVIHSNNEDEYKKRVSRLVPKPNDLVYGREGTYGDAVLLPNGYSFSLGQRTMLLRPNEIYIISRFLLYSMISPHVYQQAKAKNSGCGVGHVNVKDIKVFRIGLPTIDIQQSIVATLDSLKSKVDRLQENYAKISQECDALKQAILRQVFE